MSSPASVACSFSSKSATESPVNELERLHVAAVGGDNQAVIDEVEVDLEGDVVLAVHAPRRQATYVDIERNVPPVVSWRCRRHAHLADDLGPEVQGVLRFSPIRPEEGRATPAGLSWSRSGGALGGVRDSRRQRLGCRSASCRSATPTPFTTCRIVPAPRSTVMMW